MRGFFIGLILIISSVGHCETSQCSALVPGDSDWDFARVVFEYGRENDWAAETLTTACQKFNPNDRATEWRNTMSTELPSIVHAFTFAFQKLPDAFRNMGDSGVEGAFRGKLLDIKKLPAARDRVKAVVELVRASTSFDVGLQNKIEKKEFFSSSRALVLTPEETLKRESVCRDHARLLQWSLMQVYQSTSTSREAEVFSSEDIMATGKPFGHAWVRVNLPVREKGRIVRHSHFDIDVTNDKQFTPSPLMAQNEKNEKVQSKWLICQKLLSCLGRGLNANDIPASRRISNPTVVH